MQSRTVCFLAIAVLAGCGGGAPKSDAEAVSQVLTDAAKALADGDGDKTCRYLTPDAQRQAQLQVGAGPLANLDCPTLIKRGTAFLSPLDREQIKSLEPANIEVNGTSAHATMASKAGGPPGQGISAQLNLQKSGEDWKISGFSYVTGAPGS